jgi:hypothetical protein
MDMFSAARSGDTKQIKELFESGLSVNIKNERGHSPLMIASYSGHFDTTKMLISLGACVNSFDESSNSILMGVVFKGHATIFELLVEAGADLDHKNKNGQIAMDLAVMFGRRNLIFRINQLQNSNRSAGKFEQIRTWTQNIL